MAISALRSWFSRCARSALRCVAPSLFPASASHRASLRASSSRSAARLCSSCGHSTLTTRHENSLIGTHLGSLLFPCSLHHPPYILITILQNLYQQAKPDYSTSKHSLATVPASTAWLQYQQAQPGYSTSKHSLATVPASTAWLQYQQAQPGYSTSKHSLTTVPASTA